MLCCATLCYVICCCACWRVQVWDFARVATEQVLAGHGGDVKCVDWHPTKALLVSGAPPREVVFVVCLGGTGCLRHLWAEGEGRGTPRSA